MIARKFLDWKEPALASAAEYLVQRYARADVLDLDRVVLVLPGARAGRRLLELLVMRAEQSELLLIPPRIETVGTLPELLYESKRPMAPLLVQQLAWIEALRSMGRVQVQRFIRPTTTDDNIAQWIAIARLLWQHHRELAAEGMDFGDVVREGMNHRAFHEQARWEFLRAVQQKYLHTLDALQLWDRQTARLYAIEHRECRADFDIILVGTADLNQAMRQMLDQVHQQVTALVFAPKKLAHAFDEHGCVEPEAWLEIPLPIDSSRIAIVEDAGEQAAEVARTIAGYQGRRRADEIAIGILDERMVPQIQRQLRQCNVDSRWVVGHTLPNTLVFRLLEAVADVIEQDRFDGFASLVRHPDMTAWLQRQGIADEWIGQLDEYYSRHLPPLPGHWLGDETEWEAIDQVYRAVQRLVAPLRGQARRLGQWSADILRLLLEVYQGIVLDREAEAGHVLQESVKQVQAALVEHEAVPAELAPLVSAVEAFRLLLEQLSQAEIPPLPDELAVELLGWLELPLDDAPALIVTSMNDRFVPKSLNSDLFLPNSLRRRLKLLDNTRRYARDAYALSVLLASRADVKLIVCRRDLQGDPLTPSRLLFADEPPTIAQRAVRFFEDSSGLPPRSDGQLSFRHGESAFHVPRPRPLESPLTALSVTAFRAYLACPYRFYLRYVLKLETSDDSAQEIDAAMFGTLVHDVLGCFGRSELRDSTDADQIRQFLRAAADQSANQRFGKHRLAAVSVQLMQLRSRLDAFAQWQADWARAGWRIRHAEQPIDYRPIVIDVPRGSMQVHGRIDRIDYHEQTGRWMIFDYKTSDTRRTPQQTHLQGDRWVDLQLPLYRRLGGLLNVPRDAQLAYICLPKDTKKTGCEPASWTDMQLESADQWIERVVACVLDQRFWPPTQPPPPNMLTEFSAICQDDAFERRFEPEGREGDR